VRCASGLDYSFFQIPLLGVGFGDDDNLSELFSYYSTILKDSAYSVGVSCQKKILMKTVQPDIIVVSPDGEYLMLVEVTLKKDKQFYGVNQLKPFMVSYGCSVGLVISKERIILLRDSLEKSNGESIYTVGEARLPDSLLPSADEPWNEEQGFEFKSRVQQWLELLKFSSSIKNLPNDLRELFGEQILNLLKIGEVRAAGPRWSKVAR